MNSELIDPPTEITAEADWQVDVEVSAHFRNLYRRLLMQSTAEKPLRTLGFTSCGRGEGVSTVAAHLAIAAAEDGDQKVLLVDANSFEPSMHRAFEINWTPGFWNVLDDAIPASDAIQPSPFPNLWMLAAGDRSVATGEPNIAAKDLLASLRKEFSFVVVDLPHVDRLADTAGLAASLDGIVLIIDAHCTGPAQARDAADELSQFDLLGAVLNKRLDSC